MQLKHRELELQLQNIQRQLQDLPSGNLICARNGKQYKWYKHTGQSNIYLPKKDRQLAEQLALKKYLNLLSEDLSHEKRAIEFYLSHHSTSNHSEELLNHPEYKILLEKHFTPLSLELSDWMKAPYNTNPNHPEHLLHKSSSGNLVRSKSESIIDMLLYLNKIPFRYECALQLGDIIFYPDFTIRHPQTGDTYYWEHFGLMDNPDYAQNTFAKLQHYTAHGIIPSLQLITTYETKEHPLSPDAVEKIITQFFLQ